MPDQSEALTDFLRKRLGAAGRKALRSAVRRPPPGLTWPRKYPAGACRRGAETRKYARNAVSDGISL